MRKNSKSQAKAVEKKVASEVVDQSNDNRIENDRNNDNRIENDQNNDNVIENDNPIENDQNNDNHIENDQNDDVRIEIPTIDNSIDEKTSNLEAQKYQKNIFQNLNFFLFRKIDEKQDISNNNNRRKLRSSGEVKNR